MSVRQRAQRQTCGKLFDYYRIKGYDEHLNLMLSDVEEKITSVDVDPMTKQEQIKVKIYNNNTSL